MANGVYTRKPDWMRVGDEWQQPEDAGGFTRLQQLAGTAPGTTAGTTAGTSADIGRGDPHAEAARDAALAQLQALNQPQQRSQLIDAGRFKVADVGGAVGNIINEFVTAKKRGRAEEQLAEAEQGLRVEREYQRDRQIAEDAKGQRPFEFQAKAQAIADARGVPVEQVLREMSEARGRDEAEGRLRLINSTMNAMRKDPRYGAMSDAELRKLAAEAVTRQLGGAPDTSSKPVKDLDDDELRRELGWD